MLTPDSYIFYRDSWDSHSTHAYKETIPLAFYVCLGGGGGWGGEGGGEYFQALHNIWEVVYGLAFQTLQGGEWVSNFDKNSIT